MFLFKNNVVSQTNLIKNGSFELDSNLQCTGSFTTIKKWDRINSVDYFTDSCHTNFRGVPINQVGESYPIHGIAYAGFVGYYTHPTIEVKEYLYQELTVPLQTDSIYCLSFFVSLADKSPLAIKTIGAYFTVNSTNTGSLWYIQATPQVVNTSGFIIDTVGWTEIQGCFIAQGGEEYITIGNFNSNANTDTASANPISPLTGTGNHISYYYLDSVTLYQNNFPTKVNEFVKDDGFSVFPNPNNGNMTMIYDLGKDSNANMNLYDVTGKLINTYDLQNSNGVIEINEAQLHNGIYFYRILVNGLTINTNKIVIIK